jgi:hypothetical protein
MSIKTILYQIISYNTTILFNNNTNSIPDNETSPYVSEENENDGYLYLLVLDLLIFSSLTYTTYNKSKSVELNSDGSDQFNIYFFKWLVIANALRALSLIFIIIISNPNGNNGISWINSVLHVVPAFVFVTSYNNLAIFFSEVYAKTSEYINHLLKPGLSIMINSGYFFLAIIAVITLLAKAYKAFFYISELLMALLYLILGSVIIYFGKYASSSLEKENANFLSLQFSSNLKKLAYSIGGLFLLKGISGVLEGIGAYSPPNHNVFDFFWFLILEILPTVIFIYLAQYLHIGNTNNADTPRSSMNEIEMGSQRSTSYRPPFEKQFSN